ncbi:hypothetical protein [Mycobacterium sp. 236(2023)]|uniref:hypothetical protein n=1 Tax=Mycobacterium sp. 236(2023) TaxID=3038163 RepID=UPI0024154324|nr:hypothetical protein [Mycobacterium sp. 236(2023)]MDG4665009.1 hypothetical protein [Mycobacterium sp. 236(2023)]
MKDDIRYSPETSALLLAMTALQMNNGVPAQEALDRAYDIWKVRGGGSWEFSELRAVVQDLTAPA